MMQMKWGDIWKLFDADEQQEACLDLANHIKDETSDPVTPKLLRKLADGTGSRTSSIREMLRSDPQRAATILRTRALAMFDDMAWVRLYTSYYPKRKSALLCAFLDELSIEHDHQGRATSEFLAPDSTKVDLAVAHLLKIYTVREVARYLAVIEKHAEGWEFVANQRNNLIEQLQGDKPDDKKSASAQSEATAASSMEFNVLDRILIEQVVRNAMGIEGCLDGRQLEELIESVVRLNEKWFRAYFHLGFMDVLTPDRSLRFNHPGDNQNRRGWYLAGVIAGLLRNNDLDGLNKVVEERQVDLTNALAEPGGPGASIARTAFRRLIDIGRVSEALAAIHGQLRYLGLEFASEALDAATIFIRQSQYEQAKAIVDALKQHELIDEDKDSSERYLKALSRRRSQCLQAAGDFVGAEKECRSLLDKGQEGNSPDLLADLGLIKGRFRSVAELKLPEGNEARIAMRESLAKGVEHFNRAMQLHGSDTPKAVYALSLYEYLRWSFAKEKDKDELRVKAAEMASSAVSAILSSEFAPIYRDYGALGQSQFMLAVTRMSGLDEVEAREALAAWQTITTEAGRFPVEDLKRLLEATDTHGPAFSEPIAESIWDYRRDDAAGILKDGSWAIRSKRLRGELSSLAKNDRMPTAERLRLWMLLIPPLIKEGDIDAAEEGLHELSILAERADDIEGVLGFIIDRANYDPVWKEWEACLARARLFRKMGRDADCSSELRSAFYQVRDKQPWEAKQILGLYDEWALDQIARNELGKTLPCLDQGGAENIERQLENGERVSILWVGGNEIQAQYDDYVISQVASKWPGVSISFEHSGWSSNWGRDLSRLTSLANSADIVILMPMMRTLLGRRLRESLSRPWVSCQSTGRTGMLNSVMEAARMALRLRH